MRIGRFRVVRAPLATKRSSGVGSDDRVANASGVNVGGPSARRPLVAQTGPDPVGARRRLPRSVAGGFDGFAVSGRVILRTRWLTAAACGLLITAFAHADSPPSEADELRFLNGDRLHGRLLSVSPDEGLLWRHPKAQEPILFSLDSVSDVRLATRTAPRREQSLHAQVRLTNDDELRGEILSLDKDRLRLRTSYAGEVALRRLMLKAILPSLAGSATIYEGPTGLEGWTRSEEENAWSFRKNSFYGESTGGIGRDVRLPDHARIEIDLSWTQYLSFSLAFHTDTLNALEGNCYFLQFNGTEAYLHRCQSDQGTRNIGSAATLSSLERKRRASFVVFVDKPRKVFRLFLDGELVQEWNDPGEFAGKGTGVFLYQDSSAGPVRVSRLRVARWDGVRGLQDTLTTSDHDVVLLTNNDKITGRVEVIGNNELAMGTSYGSIKVPIPRVAQVAFASQQSHRARRQATDVRAHLRDGGAITLALDKLDETSLVGSSENCGRVTCALDAFGRIEFQLYRERKHGEEKEDDGF